MIAERLPLLPPFRWRLKEVPLGLAYPYWIDDPEFDLEYHVRELAWRRRRPTRSSRNRPRVAGSVAAPGSHGSRRDSLPSPGSSHQPSVRAPTHLQWANRPGSRSCSPVHHRLNRLKVRNRSYFFPAQRLR